MPCLCCLQGASPVPFTPDSPLLTALKLQQEQKEAGKAIAEILRLLLRPGGCHTRCARWALS